MPPWMDEARLKTSANLVIPWCLTALQSWLVVRVIPADVIAEMVYWLQWALDAMNSDQARRGIVNVINAETGASPPA